MRIYPGTEEWRTPTGACSGRHALQQITAAIGEVLDEQEGELDMASRFAVTWWDQFGWQAGPFGEADKIARDTEPMLTMLSDPKL